MCVSLLATGTLPAPHQAGAATAPQPAAQIVITPTTSGVHFAWQKSTADSRADREAAPWPLVEYNGLRLPGQLLTLQVTAENTPAPLPIRFERLASRAWTERAAAYTAAISPLPQTVDGPPRPDLAASRPARLPDSPVVELRRGRMAGAEIAVLLVSRLFAEGDAVREVTELAFAVDGAALLPAGSGPDALPTALFSGAADVAAPSPISTRRHVQVSVSAEGIQEIALDDLRHLGLFQSDAEIPYLGLFYNDTPVALHEDGSGGLRFYAPRPDDRWNATDIYRLVLESDPGSRMATRPALTTPDLQPPVRDSAWESGLWYAPTLYDSTLAGPDGDHWFGADLRAGPELTPMTVTLPLSARLPAIDAAAHFSLTGAAYTKGAHNLRVVAGAGAPVLLAWSGTGNWTRAFTATAPFPPALDIATVPGSAPDGVELDRLFWQRPVALRFLNGGGLFATQGEAARYRLRATPFRFSLYDISDPRQPALIDFSGQPVRDSLLLDSPGQGRFLLLPEEYRLHLPHIGRGAGEGEGVGAGQARVPSAAGLGSGGDALRRQPRLRLVEPVDLRAALDADGLYIAPALFHSPLQPLLEKRRADGYRVALVDVEAIYAGWSGGRVAPEAIRDFLRWAAAESDRLPQAVTLVGDGTSDPLNYTGRDNPNFVPPYLLPVDPWLGETACESCFGQLDGPSPLDDSLPDLPVGRIPAKNEDDVRFYVSKLLGYETNPAPLAQRARQIFVADNFRDASGRVDAAGDFALSAEAAVALQPDGAQIERVYFDPSPSHTLAPWREPEPVAAWQKTRDALNRGGGFAVYVGHAHHWQWASTDLNAQPPYLLGLFDADDLTNRDNLPILLEMTCLTGMFQQPAFSGTTIDERLLFHTSGGAAAIWAPTGFGVAYGHDALQRGFFRRFWNPQSQDRRLGGLTQAGYLALFAEGVCCQESLRTFAILGDPLTMPQAGAEWKQWLPGVEE